VLHLQTTERSGRRDSHRRLTVAQRREEFERGGIGDRRSQDDAGRVRRVATDRWLLVAERLDEGRRQFRRNRPELAMEPRGLERRRRVDRTIRAWRQVNTDHAGDGALADIDLGIAE